MYQFYYDYLKPNMVTNAPFYLQTPIPSVAIFKPKMSIFCWYSTFLLSHQAFSQTRQILPTQRILLTRPTT